jgi:TRAP-type C4-dicarboxylate transport system permease small subunit
LGWFGIAALVAMMLLTGTDVFLRFFFRSGIFGTVEIIGNYLMVAVVFLPLAFSMVKSGHISVDFVVTNLSRRPRAALGAMGMLLSFVIMALIGWHGAVGTFHSWESGDTMVNLKLSMWPGKILVPIGCFLLCIQIILSIYRNAGRFFRKFDNRDKKEE